MKKLGAIFLSVIMTLSCGSTVFAEVFDHDIDSGDLDVNSGNLNEDGYRVYSSSGSSSSHKIVVNGVSTTITLDNVDIETTDGSSAIDIGDDASVELVVSGENSLAVTNSTTNAGIHVSGGSLTISGTNSDEDSLTVNNLGSDGAAIGSDSEENFTGTITVDDGVTVSAGYYDQNYDYNKDGAGIGSGKHGDMSGTITINDGSVVKAYAVDYGAGIGSGESGYMSGDIVINGGDVTAYSGSVGTGIGAGDMGDIHEIGGMTGNITINGGTVNASSQGGAGIGTGDYGEMNGTITINGGNITVEGSNGGIGTEGDTASGEITINSEAVITLGYENYIGSGNSSSTGSVYLYYGAEINGITVLDADELKEAGIINDNMNVEMLGEKPSSSTSFSMKKLSIVQRIKASDAGDTVYIYESQLSKGKLPYYVLDSLSKMDDVTLVVISDNGDEAEIKSSNVPEKGKNSFFTVSQLLEMINN